MLFHEDGSPHLDSRLHQLRIGRIEGDLGGIFQPALLPQGFGDGVEPDDLSGEDPPRLEVGSRETGRFSLAPRLRIQDADLASICVRFGQGTQLLSSPGVHPGAVFSPVHCLSMTSMPSCGALISRLFS